LVLFVGANDIFRLMMHDQSAPGESDWVVLSLFLIKKIHIV
jgi:hypothetical protein